MMRILLGYNGSEASAAALRNLQDAGFPRATQVLILSVAELWVEPRSKEAAAAAATEARSFLKENFPNWAVYTETAVGSPAREILARAETYKPDLIVLGESTQTIEDRNIFLGETSRTILNEAECPVRIARGNVQSRTAKSKIIVGFDGSAGAMNAVRAIAAKNWVRSPEVRLLTVTDLGLLTDLGDQAVSGGPATVDLSIASRWAKTVAAKALSLLKNAGVPATIQTRIGNAKDAIIEEAERWGADTIYVGPHASANSFDRYILGSVSAAVAARAHCSVEVIRPVTY